MTVIASVPNPRYPGNAGASREERTAAGYPDIDITQEDIRSNQQVVAEAIARHLREKEAEGASPLDE
jgi:hypothetical protein